MSPDEMFVHADEVVAQAVQDTLVLFHMESGGYFSLNEFGARIWSFCDGSHAVGDIAKVVVNEYDVTLDRAEEDITGLCEQLLDRGLIRRSTGTFATP